MKLNRDRAELRRHLMMEHYLQHWESRLNLLAPGSDVKEIKCDLPNCDKKKTGATLEGARKSIVYHWASEHEELKGILSKDAGISKDFVEQLYADESNKNMREDTTGGGASVQKQVNISDRVAGSIVGVLDLNHKQSNEQNQEKETKNRKQNSDILSSEEEDGGDSLLQDSEEENSAGNALKVPAAVSALPGSGNVLSGRPLPNKRKKKKKPLMDISDDSMSTTTDDDDDDEEEDEAAEDSSEDSSNGEQSRKLKPYILKRSRINFNSNSGDESDEWDEGKKGNKKRKGDIKAKRSQKSDSASGDGDTVAALKNRPPRRASAANASLVIKQECISDEEEV